MIVNLILCGHFFFHSIQTFNLFLWVLIRPICSSKTKVIMQIYFGRRFGCIAICCRQTRKVRNLFHVEIDSDDRKMTNGQNQWTTSQKNCATLSAAVGIAQVQLKKQHWHLKRHEHPNTQPKKNIHFNDVTFLSRINL